MSDLPPAVVSDPILARRHPPAGSKQRTTEAHPEDFALRARMRVTGSWFTESLGSDLPKTQLELPIYSETGWQIGGNPADHEQALYSGSSLRAKP